MIQVLEFFNKIVYLLLQYLQMTKNKTVLMGASACECFLVIQRN